MPTQRFFKLKEEKRRLILEAAAHEIFPCALFGGFDQSDHKGGGYFPGKLLYIF
mgnify:CR=1 FL=1